MRNITPKYDEMDAISVDKVAEIPYDYYGVMGVPITFLYKWNREQFDVLGTAKVHVNGKLKFLRILIKRKEN